MVTYEDVLNTYKKEKNTKELSNLNDDFFRNCFKLISAVEPAHKEHVLELVNKIIDIRGAKINRDERKINIEDNDIIFDWPNAEGYDQVTQEYVDKETIWNEKQNYPDLIVEDILTYLFEEERILKCDENPTEEDVANFLYATLLRRGVNKWLFVRQLLIRQKKIYKEEINRLRKEIEINRKLDNWKNVIRLKSELKVYQKVRSDLLILCQAPRYCLWSGKRVGLVNLKGVKSKKNFLNKLQELTEHKFKD